MQQRSRLLLVATATLLIGLLVFFPARVAYRWFVPDGVAVSGIDGTLWSGNASVVSVQGLYLQDVQWRIRPQSLLAAKLGYALEARLTSGFVEGNIALGVGGSMAASEVNASLPLRALQDVLSRPGLDGTINLQLASLRIDSGLPVAVDGTVQVAQLVLPWVDRGSLGGYRAELFTQQDGIAASVEDTDGVVDLAGSLTVASDGAYSFVAQLAAKPGAPAGVRQQLRFLGTPDERGQVELRIEGRL